MMWPSFGQAEDGAITVDWVVLSAAIVGLALGLVATLGTGTNSLSAQAGGALSATRVSALGTLGYGN